MLRFCPYFFFSSFHNTVPSLKKHKKTTNLIIWSNVITSSMMDHAAGVRWFQLVCSTAIANICLSVKWIISKKGFFFFCSFCSLFWFPVSRTHSSSSSSSSSWFYFIFNFFFFKLLTSSTFHLQVCNEKKLPVGFFLFMKVPVSIKY